MRMPDRLPPPGQSLSEVAPEIAATWDYRMNDLTPDLVFAGASRQAWWICKNGHSWKSIVRLRAARHTGCTYCSGRALLLGFNDFSTKFPRAASEWDHERNSVLPGAILFNSREHYHWKCEDGHLFRKTAAKRSQEKVGCPECHWLSFDRRAETPERHPGGKKVERYWDLRNGPFPKSEVLSIKSLTWRCPGGHSFIASAQWVARAKEPCTVCSGTLLLRGFNDIRTLNEILSRHWHTDRNNGVQPSDVPVNSSICYWWTCPSGHSWRATPRNLNEATRAVLCRVCTVRSVPPDRSLSRKNPELLREWDHENNHLDPERTGAFSTLEAHWICSEGHRWVSPILNRSQGAGCGVCTGRRLEPGVNSLAETNPDIASEWDYELNSLEPGDVLRGSDAIVQWVCTRGHKWSTTVGSRTQRRGGTGCPTCTNRKVLPGFNDLGTVRPDLAAQWGKGNDFSPSEITAGATRMVQWICEAGHEWSALAYSRNKDDNALCSTCIGVGSSRVEVMVRDALSDSKILDHVHSGAGVTALKWPNGVSVRVDVLGHLGSQRVPVAVEYDGLRYHGNPDSVVRDTGKTLRLLDAGFLVIRLRENELPHLEVENQNLGQFTFQHGLTLDAIDKGLEPALAWLSGKSLEAADAKAA